MDWNKFDYSDGKVLAERALTYRSLRQDLISSNISNVDTPMYRPKDINFEQMLATEAKEIFSSSSTNELDVAKTDSMHLEGFVDDEDGATIFFRDGHAARNDGNSVDLDVETSEMSKNAIMYNALVGGINKQGQIFKYAIESSKSL